MSDQKEKSFNIERFIKGVNDGHLLAKYASPVADQIAKSENRSEWFEGMREGQKLYLQSKAREYRPKFLLDRFNQTDPHMKNPDKGDKSQPKKDQDKER